ncbi:uncharacterized protein BDW43DRAFT_298469 [Aspergillus alliaceus]|uniref:uncharacterized protein n=1 Tax=Petromyces alliaceus TaxID=209559 RepID=UPI0012A69BBE|nr:uncharacterized protein BDW43DRAFT_298469 [Aspergillus alliaceus]KAB8236400.1 hypothetical protein BDW43DRAFT_298469 [Aspergillus alliaceus]
MPRSRQPARFSSEAPSESSSSSSPDRNADDDTDFFTAQANDSQSSVGGVATSREVRGQDDHYTLPPIGRLPPEILIAIFAKLSSPADMLSCMLVCRGWAANCVGILWHRPSCSNWTNMKSITATVGTEDSFFSYSDLIKRLNLSALMEEVSDGTVVPFAQCNRIERLTLTNCSKLTDKGVSDLVEGNRHLQALDVSDLRSLTDHTLYTVARNCPRLQGLNITNCIKVTDDSLIVISENSRHIKRLKLNGVVQVTDRAIISFARNCPAILEIDLHDCKSVTNRSVTSLMATLPNLRELRLAHCTEIDDLAFLELPKQLSMDSLRILDLTACEHVRDDAVERIVSSAPRLRNLVLAKCRFITDRAVWAICKLGKNLHYVHLGHCSNITDTAVIQLVKSCNRIRYIDLACCNRLTDQSVQQLATLPKLRRIGLVKCTLITNRSILALARPKVSPHPSISSLERVHLSYCVNLTMPGIHALLNNCPRLTHLSLTGVQEFLRDELTKFCREAPAEFTHQQREVFCVFSGDGVKQLRDHLNRTIPPAREMNEATMYEDDEELDEEEGQVTGLMHATAINDDDYIDIGHPQVLEGQYIMASFRLPRANPLAFTRWPVTLITAIVYLALVIPLLVVHHVVPSAPSSAPKGLNISEAWADLQVLTNGFHPYNSHRNDVIHSWLLRRINEILDAAPSEQEYRGVDEEKPDVFVFDDVNSNLTTCHAGLGVYFEGTNIIVYIRGSEDDTEKWWEAPSGVPTSKGGVLVNSHYDSVSTGFGATDDGYFTTPGHAPRRGLVVLFNNGEEDYLNGARVYSQHPISRLPHTFLNLEGAGAGGRATLFRSSDFEVTGPYMRSQHPFGSVLSANGFESGLISSQTDYVVFEGDLGLRGLDVAFIEPRARYHTNQDDTRHTSKDSVWHMLSAAVATTEGLVSDSSNRFDGAPNIDGGVPSGSGSKAVWFDLFGSTFVLFQLHTLFALLVTLLIVGPLTLLITSIFLTKADKMYLFRSSAKSEDGIDVVPLQGLRGFFRFPFLFGIPTVVVVVLAYLITKVNPYIIHNSAYAVWSMMIAAWVFLAWFVSRVADFARPSAFHRIYTLTWMYLFSWVLAAIATVYANQKGLAGGYFVFFFHTGIFLATWISYLELFFLPPKCEYASQFRPTSRRISTPGSRLGTASGEEDDGEDAEEEPTESTSLLGSGQRTTFANYVRVTGDSHNDAEDEVNDPHIYGREQSWSSALPKWTWVLQLLLTAPITLIMVGPLGLLITSAINQTGEDGGSPLFIYVAIAIFTTILFTPLLPFIHRYTYHIPLFLLAVFLGTLIYNLVAFPFSASNRLKLYYVQELDLVTGVNRATFAGVSPFVEDATLSLPSAAGQNIACAWNTRRKNLLSCSWEGLPPQLVEGDHPMKDWVSFNISKSTDKSQARLEVSGLNTRACRIVFDTPVKDFHVAGSAYDPRFPNDAAGIEEIRLWSREWEHQWIVDVQWDEGDLTGNVVCLWSDHNRPGVIPALDEAVQFAPDWVAVTKVSDGLVEGRRAFEIRNVD